MQEGLGEREENGRSFKKKRKKEIATEQAVNVSTDFQFQIRARSEMGPYS